MKTDAQPPRKQSLYVRLSDEERKLIDEAARLDDRSSAEWARINLVKLAKGIRDQEG